jgi:hypothetical protein
MKLKEQDGIPYPRSAFNTNLRGELSQKAENSSILPCTDHYLTGNILNPCKVDAGYGLDLCLFHYLL